MAYMFIFNILIVQVTNNIFLNLFLKDLTHQIFLQLYIHGTNLLYNEF